MKPTAPGGRRVRTALPAGLERKLVHFQAVDRENRRLPSLISIHNLGKVRNKGLELNADVRFNRYFTGFANYS